MWRKAYRWPTSAGLLLLASVLVAGAVVLALLGPGHFARDSVHDASTDGDLPLSAVDTAIIEVGPDSLPLSSRSEQPQGLGARLLSDSDATRRNLFGMTIRDAGYECPEVRTADTVAPGGEAWRAYCGALRLYWIEVDETGRMSVEPGTYNESEFGIDAGGAERTLTIRPEELEQFQEVR